jgi:hypothetical protein
VQKTQYWNWNAAHDAPRCSTDQEHAACFFDLFTDSVRSRVRSRDGVAAGLSGGLDSTSVVCVAATLPEMASASSRLETFSLIFPGMSCDEQPYITEVARACGLPSRCFAVGRERLVDPTSRASLSLDWPTLPHDVMFGDLRNDVRRTSPPFRRRTTSSPGSASVPASRSGGKPLKKRRNSLGANRVAGVLRMPATSLQCSKTGPRRHVLSGGPP